jgi:hypothetical protein
VLSKLRDNRSILQKVSPERRTKPGWFAGIAKTSPAGMTKIALNTCYNSYLFCFPRSAEMAFFSSLFTSLNNNGINYMILNNTLPFPDTDFCNYASIFNSFQYRKTSTQSGSKITPHTPPRDFLRFTVNLHNMNWSTVSPVTGSFGVLRWISWSPPAQYKNVWI